MALKAVTGFVQDTYNRNLAPVINSTGERIKSYLPKNEEFRQVQRLNQQIGQLQGVLGDESAEAFTSQIALTQQNLNQRLLVVEARLSALEGDFYQDPKGLIHQAKQSGSSEFAALLEEQKALTGERKGIVVALASNPEEKLRLQQKKVELAARQQELCGKYFKDPSGLIHKAHQTFKTTGHGHGAYQVLETERTKNENTLKFIKAVLSTESSGETTIVGLTRTRIQDRVSQLSRQRDTLAARAGIDVRQTGIGVVTAIAVPVIALMSTYLQSGNGSGPQIYDNGLQCSYLPLPSFGGNGTSPLLLPL